MARANHYTPIRPVVRFIFSRSFVVEVRNLRVATRWYRNRTKNQAPIKVMMATGKKWKSIVKPKDIR